MLRFYSSSLTDLPEIESVRRAVVMLRVNYHSTEMYVIFPSEFTVRSRLEGIGIVIMLHQMKVTNQIFCLIPQTHPSPKGAVRTTLGYANSPSFPL